MTSEAAFSLTYANSRVNQRKEGQQKQRNADETTHTKREEQHPRDRHTDVTHSATEAPRGGEGGRALVGTRMHLRGAHVEQERALEKGSRTRFENEIETQGRDIQEAKPNGGTGGGCVWRGAASLKWKGLPFLSVSV